MESDLNNVDFFSENFEEYLQKYTTRNENKDVDTNTINKKSSKKKTRRSNDKTKTKSKNNGEMQKAQNLKETLQDALSDSDSDYITYEDKNKRMIIKALREEKKEKAFNSCDEEELKNSSEYDPYLPSTSTGYYGNNIIETSESKGNKSGSELIIVIDSDKENECSQREPKAKNIKRKKIKDPNVIVIGSDSDDDSDYEPIKFKTNTSVIEKIKVEDNSISQILIQWKNKIEKFPLRKFEKFRNICDEYAKRENVNAKDILLTLNSKLISLNDTIDSVDYRFGDIITCLIVPDWQLQLGNKTKKSENLIPIKVQSNKWKNRKEMVLIRNQNFKAFYIECSEIMKNAKCILKFDGDIIDPASTPEELELEGGEIIDCIY